MRSLADHFNLFMPLMLIIHLKNLFSIINAMVKYGVYLLTTKMEMPLYSSSCKISGLIATVVFAFSLPAYAEPLNEAISTEVQTNTAAINSQKKIDRLNDQSRSMLEQYRSASRQAETLETYNNHIRDLVESQQLEKASLQKQLQEIEVTQWEILPLMLNMLKSLERFIELDVPFLADERQQRLEKLKSMMVRADISHAEKFRRILEAYQIENDYGNSIEAYRAELEIEGKKRAVDFLRLGRVALYYQSLDGLISRYWDAETKAWQLLDPEYRNPIRNGIRIARKQTAPDLLLLPIPAAEAAK